MLTIFACPKPFTDPHIAIIQRNAITSWTLLRPRPEIILFGDEPGVAEICGELGLRHMPEVERNEYGTPLLNDCFEKAERLASYDILGYINADIILMSDFIEAVGQVCAQRSRFLMVGRRWNVDIKELINFGDLSWEHKLCDYVKMNGVPGGIEWIDYFVFRKGIFGYIPPFAVGRVCFDNWLVWRAITNHVSVVDASSVVIAVHQNHDYAHVPGGYRGSREGEEARRNRQLAGGGAHFCILTDAPYRLTTSGIKRNLSLRYFWRRLDKKARLSRMWYRIWFMLLDWTRPIRHRLGLRRPSSGRAR